MSEAISSTHSDSLTRLVILLMLELEAEITDTITHDLGRDIVQQKQFSSSVLASPKQKRGRPAVR
jgi:hypothetical protein